MLNFQTIQNSKWLEEARVKFDNSRERKLARRDLMAEQTSVKASAGAGSGPGERTTTQGGRDRSMVSQRKQSSRERYQSERRGSIQMVL